MVQPGLKHILKELMLLAQGMVLSVGGRSWKHTGVCSSQRLPGEGGGWMPLMAQARPESELVKRDIFEGLGQSLKGAQSALRPKRSQTGSRLGS